MKEKFIVYGLFDPRDGELRYVGQTSRGKDRYWEFHGVNCGSVHHVLAGKHSHAGGISFHFVEASP